MSTVRNHRLPFSLGKLALILAAFCLSDLPLLALEMGPGMFMVQDVPPGREINLHKLGGVLFTVTNKSNEAQDYTLSCNRPSKGGLAAWEKGYEEIPNAAWCYLEETNITVPAKSQKQVGLIINIPDEPENYNRKFILAVILNSGKTGNTSIGLAVACRVQIETATSDNQAGATGAPIALTPGTLTLSGKPGAAITGTVQVRNNTGKPIDAQVERLPQVYPDPDKHARFLSNGYQTHAGEPWLVPHQPAFKLESGGTIPLELSGTIPATAVPGKPFEELAFIHATTADGSVVYTLVRVHVTAAAAEPPPKP